MAYTDPTQSLGGRQVFPPGHTRASAGRSDAAQGQELASAGDEGLWGDDGFGFDDFLDVINPLQHLPVVATVYREFTGDQIAAGPRVIGGGIYGGVIGLAASLVDAAIENETGRDVGGHVMAWLNSDDAAPEDTPLEVMVASATPEPPAETEPLRMPAAVRSEPLDLVAPAGAETAAPQDDNPQSLSEAQWQSLIGALTRVGGNPTQAAAIPMSPQPPTQIAMANPGEAPAEPLAVPAPATRSPTPALGFPGTVSNEDFLSLMSANLQKYQEAKRSQFGDATGESP